MTYCTIDVDLAIMIIFFITIVQASATYILFITLVQASATYILFIPLVQASATYILDNNRSTKKYGVYVC
jgi:hypothetical protein